MTVRFNTTEYQMAHGKAPRGYGMWGFCPATLVGRDNYLDFVVWYTGTYAHAKRSAQAYFSAKGVPDVVVCS